MADFVPCLIVRRGVMTRHYVEADEIETLSINRNGVGDLACTMQCTEDDEYYQVWLRIVLQRRQPAVRPRLLKERELFIQSVNNELRRSAHYIEIIIARFTSGSFNKLRYIDEKDPIIGQLKCQHASVFAEWLNSADDLAPTRNKPNNAEPKPNNLR